MRIIVLMVCGVLAAGCASNARSPDADSKRAERMLEDRRAERERCNRPSAAEDVRCRRESGSRDPLLVLPDTGELPVRLR